ncbi:DMT family transporter [Ochrobactrum sp. WV_118_8]|uniref:DMT family transporter n=1 Tax=Brucella anthropi TaxID=529 RepID=UPI00188D6B8A|nr:DMT family transporter [Brucella anthropi]QPA29854.1 DMT family transporter [Brucella anthropi]
MTQIERTDILQIENLNSPVPVGSTEKTNVYPNVIFGVVAMLTAALLNSLGSVLSKILLGHFSVSQLAFGRVLVTFVILLLICAVRIRRIPPLTSSDVMAFIGYGLAGMVMSPCMYFGAIDRISIGVVLILEYSAPIIVLAYLRLVRGELIPRPIAVAMAICIVGLACVALSGGALVLNATGIFFGFGAAIALAAVYLLAEKSLKNRPTLFISTFGYLVGSIAWIFLAPVWSFPFDMLNATVQVTLGNGISGQLNVTLMFMILGGAFTVLPTLLMLSGIRILGPARASSLSISEPIISSVIAWLVLGQVLSPLQFLGGGITIIGLLLLERARRYSRTL